MRRVVITGMGAVTPVGLNVADFWDSVKAKRTGFGPITKFDTSDYKAKLAAELKDFQRQRKPWKIPDFPWRKKILTGSAFP